MVASAIAAGIGAVGSIIGGKSKAKATKQATAQQVAGQQQAIAFQREFLAQNRADLLRAVDAGLVDINDAFSQAQAQLQPFGQFGTDILGQVRDLFAQGPGELTPQQEREFGRGVEALQAGFSRVSGGGVSSRALERAQQFGQDFAARRFTDELNRRLPFLQIGAQGAANLANLATGFGRSTSDLRLRGALGGAQIGSQVAPGIAAGFGNIGTAQGLGTLGQQDAFAKTLNDIISGTTGLQNQIGAGISNLFSSRQPTGNFGPPQSDVTGGLPFF